MTVLGIIPARGGSKGVPRKNIVPVGGRPLLAYTAEAALGAKRLSRVILSTEDEEIAEVGRRCGLDVPFLRPAELALDSTPTLPVLVHAVSELERAGFSCDAVCLLQPTNPLRDADTIDRCIELFEQSKADCAVTVLPIPAEHNPYWAFLPSPDGTLRLAMGGTVPIPRRQDLPPAYFREGSVYVTARRALMEEKSLYGHRVVGVPLAPEDCVNIDDAADLARAEELLRARLAGGVRC